MSIAELRKDLETIRASAKDGDLSRIVQTVDHALRTLDDSRPLTTSEAAELLGIRSVNTLKLLVRQSDVPYEMHGNRMMLPISALEQLQQSAALRGIRASEKAHDAIDALGTEQGVLGLTNQQLRHLATTRPGHLPWQTAKADG
jgi:hypothetical protein